MSNIIAFSFAFKSFCLILALICENVWGNSETIEVVSASPYTTRLPRNVVPMKYIVRLRPVLEDNPDFGQWTAPGGVTIQFKVTSETDMVVMHAHNLTILEAEVTLNQTKENSNVKITSQRIDMQLQTYSIMTETKLMADETYELFVPFIGSMMNKKQGLCGFAYPDLKPPGGLKLAAMSRFQPYHAREAFPCFDEPQFRAVFELRIARMEKYQTFSNSRIRESLPCQVKGWVWDRYEPTPPMPPHLVNVIVVDEYVAQVPANMPNGTDVKVWGPEPVISSGGASYALDLSVKALQYFEDYFDMPYPLPKLDSVLVWQSFGPALEHWGTIVYSLVGGAAEYFPGSTPDWKRFNVASLVTHEVLHQWMGNLVSTSWWSDIWIHEGFAEYFSDLALAHDSPEYLAEVTFINSHSQIAFRFDQTQRSHPVRHNFTMTRARGMKGEDTDTFDETIYSKGATLVRMIRYFLTESVFQDGVRTFFKKFAYQSVTQEDLFETFNSVSKGLPATMTEIMDTWTLQEGYPVVRVMKQDDSNVKTSQEPFQSGKNPDRMWQIPLLVSSEAQPKEPYMLHWLSQKEQIIPIDTSKWYIVNSEAAGYYRVLYEPENLEKIVKQLEMDHMVINPLTRSQLFDDYFTFAQFSYVPIEQALSLTRYLDKERQLVVWTSALAHLKYPINMFNGDPNTMSLQKFLVPKIEAALKSQELNLEGVDKATGAIVLLQLELLKYGCILQSPMSMEYAVKQMQMWKAMPEKNPIDPDLQLSVYCSGVAGGDKEMWDFVQKIHDSTPPSEQKMYLFKALTCSTDKAVLEAMLEDSWRAGPRSALQTLEAFTDNAIARPLVLESLIQNMEKIYAEDFVHILSELAEYYMAPEHIQRVQDLEQSNMEYFRTAMHEMREEINKLKANVMWLENTGKKMETWCAAHL